MNNQTIKFELSFRGQDYKVEADIDTVDTDTHDIYFDAINMQTGKIYGERDNKQLSNAVREKLEEMKEDGLISDLADDIDSPKAVFLS